MNEAAIAALRLQASGVVARKQLELIRALGSAEAVLAASPDSWRECCSTLTPGDLAALAAAPRLDVSGVLKKLTELGAGVIALGLAGYPALLTQIEDPPILLYAKGTFEKADELAVAIVGTRECTPYGESVTQRLAGALARRGFTIVSGLAVGIDAAAHRGALDAGGRTIGVMACGLDVDYPKSNRDLRERMAASGVVVTEMPLGSAPRREVFPQRNRIVSGLSLGAIVVEAPTRSGALITANLALDQGREVFAVPGDVRSPTSRGCHALIKDGARLVESADDVVEGLGMLLHELPERKPMKQVQADLSADEQALVTELSAGPRQLDQMVVATGLPAARVSAALMLLEVKQMIKRLTGGAYTRVA